MSSIRALVTHAVVVIVQVILVAQADAVVPYTITDIGTLGGSWSRAYGMNEHGQVVGDTVTPDGATHAFVWDSGAMTDLGTLGGDTSKARAVNDAGQVVGWAEAPGGDRYPFLYEYGAMVALTDVPDDKNDAYDINASGQVVGFARNAAGGFDGFLWDGAMQATFGSLESMAINDTGQVGFTYVRPNGIAVLCRWENGVTTELYTTDYDPFCNPNGVTGINENERMVGSLYDHMGAKHASLWSDDDLHDLHDLHTSDAQHSEACAINNSGQVVGSWLHRMTSPPYEWVPEGAFVWDGGEGAHDLNDLIDPDSGWNLLAASDINDAGAIVGYGINPDGDTHAVLLTPIPEPDVLALLSVGILAMMKRRRS